MRPHSQPAFARRPSKRASFPARAIFTCICGLVAGLSVAVAPAQAQSLFDVLFGRSPGFAPQPPFASPHPFAPPLRQPGYGFERARPPGERAPRRVTARADEKPAKYVAPEVLAGPLGRFLLDPTLRRGDVVATARGLMVFRGEPGARHAERDFVALSGAKNFTAGGRADLVALEKALKRGHAPTHVGERLAAVDPPIVAQDEAKR